MLIAPSIAGLVAGPLFIWLMSEGSAHGTELGIAAAGWSAIAFVVVYGAEWLIKKVTK